MILEGARTFRCDYAKVAVMLLNITDFQRCEEELAKLTTNHEHQQLRNGDWSYATSSLEYREC